jgi:ABC-type nitrate/sulfonate/bicarbonate transport system substrate-binding protein
MNVPARFQFTGVMLLIINSVLTSSGWAQGKLRLSHSALESSNAVWYVAQERGFYKKNSLEAELLFIPSTTTSVSSLLAGDYRSPMHRAVGWQAPLSQAPIF